MIDINAMFTLSYGLYVIGSRSGGRINGQIANAVFQITNSPMRIAVAINKEELTHEFLSDTGVCSINVLSEEAGLPFIGQFGFRTGREVDKFADVSHTITPSGCPCPDENILACIDLSIKDSLDAGSHTLFIGEVTNCTITGEGTPMTYSFYREVLTGKTPPTAPSHIAENKDIDVKLKREDKLEMKKYVCNICGYVYDPEKGDPDSGIAPGTAFEDIPEDWVCPVCGVSKDQFSEQ